MTPEEFEQVAEGTEALIEAFRKFPDPMLIDIADAKPIAVLAFSIIAKGILGQKMEELLDERDN